MGLSLEDFVKKSSKRCGFTRVLEACPPDVRELAEQAMAGDPEIFPGTRIAEILTEQSGIKLGAFTVTRHRRGQCSCGD